MTVQIEKIDTRHYVVRCVNPANPPFKGTEVKESIEKATLCAAQMLAFPDRTSKERYLRRSVNRTISAAVAIIFSTLFVGCADTDWPPSNPYGWGSIKHHDKELDGHL